MKKLSVSVLKEISDKNYEKYNGYSVDVDEMLNEYPNLTDLEVYETLVYRGRQMGKHLYQVLLKHPKPNSLWLSQTMTEKQVKRIEKLTSLNLL